MVGTEARPRNGTGERLVRGWISPAEREALYRLADGAEVLELGSFEGLSTAAMARRAKRVHSVDWHRGDAGTAGNGGDNPWTLPAMADNLRELGLLDKVVLHVGRFEDILPLLKPQSFDVVFVDGAHDLASVRADLTQATRLVRPGGLICCHDTDQAGVATACNETFGRGPAGRVDTLAWYYADTPASTSEAPAAPVQAPKAPREGAVAFLALPSYGGMEPRILRGIMEAVPSGSTVVDRWTWQQQGGSLLALGFNTLWCQALNTRERHRWTHFAMMHSDIEAQPGWLEQLIEEQQRCGADVLSVVVPIKDGRGLTSTGVRSDERGVRRITMKQLFKLPETFGVEDCRGVVPDVGADDFLAINTGLWVCDFTKPWVEKVWFGVLDGISREDNGKFRPKVLPEDWHFSGMCHQHGLKVMATRKIKVAHHGGAAYRNDTDFGTCEEDPGDVW